MVMVESTMLALGTKAPAFDLTDVVSGKSITLETFEGKKACWLCLFACTVLLSNM